ncbi:unnamed protein product [Cylindrotheca closterium]|uniref:NAD-dependent epimerase/dehydratase domain-containing protein n=1 Tax=Cylindrotheca closterium TaxID=2856 RepID=A0AAD2FLU7_9STRA|nr:unnamed protein product [Cylindrotheca closterium]
MMGIYSLVSSLAVFLTPTLAFQVLTTSQRGLHGLAMTSDASSAGLDVTVVGGSGFVGSKVCQSLIEKGAKVTSVSKSGKIPSFAWCDDSWTSKVNWVATDLETADESSIATAIGSPQCIVSCLGVIGNEPEALKKGNGETNCAAFGSAKKGGKLERAVYVSVSAEVAACQENWLPEFFGGYFEGKKMAEQCALDTVDGDSSKVCFVKPTFIYGGDAFGLLPPRVNKEYGSFIEELLSLGVIKFFADITPGLIKVALRPPSSVDAVADACVSAAIAGSALGKDLDGAAAINEITNQPAATGLTDAIEFAGEKLGQAYGWAKEEVPKAVAKLEEMSKK